MTKDIKFFDPKESKSKSKDSSKEFTARCYESHPAFPISTEKGNFFVYGGSASYPKVTDADIYVSLQAGSTSDKSSDPWDEQKVVEIHYAIPDQYAPPDLDRFKKMLKWLAAQLEAGKKVHIGCIGGHGRTGLVLSALYATMTGEKDAIQYVRKHYCKRAVESKTQIRFLMQHFGCSKAEPTKDWPVLFGSSKHYGSNYGMSGSTYHDKVESYVSKPPQPHVVKGVKTYSPVASSRCLWRPFKSSKPS